MQLINNGTQGPATMPAKQAPSGTPGFANNQPGVTTSTRWDADVANTIIAEISNVVLATGTALDVANNAQLLAAIRYLIAASSPSSLGGNGWKKYPDPNSPTGYFIEQWGLSTLSSNSNTNVTLPIAFPNVGLTSQATFGAVLTAGNTYSVGAAIVGKTTINIVVVTNVTATLGVYWSAKGY